VLQHPPHAEALGRAIAERTRDLRPTVVLSPALGGVVIGHEVARALGIRAIFAERQDGALMLRRGFVVGESDRVLVVEDVLTNRRVDARDDAGREGGGGPCGRRRVDRQPEYGDAIGRAVRRAARPCAARLRARQVPAVRAGVAVVKPGSRPVPV